MSTTAITGRGATASFGTSTFTSKIQQVKLLNFAKEKVDATDLGIADSDPEKLIPGDNHSLSEIEITYFFDPTKALLKPTSTTENLTITPRKMLSASAAASTLVCSGYISGHDLPTLARNQAATAVLKFQPDGDATKPTFTVEA